MLRPIDLTFNCLIWGEYSSDWFKVKSSNAESVRTLKYTLKDIFPAKLRNVDAGDIKVYKIDAAIAIPDDDDADANMKFEKTVLQALIRPKRGDEYVSHAFGTVLNDKNLHVVVDVPLITLAPLELSYIMYSEEVKANNILVVTIDRRKRVADLVDVIKQKALSHGSVLSGYPKIWGVSIPVDDLFEDRIKKFDLSQKELSPLERLSVCFPIKPLDFHLQIVVEVPRANNILPSPSIEMLSMRRRQFLEENPPCAPSMSKEYKSRQEDEKSRILCGRPRQAASAIPIQLLHPTFGAFLDDCRNCDVTAIDNANVLELSELMCQFYDMEDERSNAIRHKLETDCGLSFAPTFTGDIDYHSAIVEIKNEFPSRGCEPYFQAGLSYLEKTRKIAPKRPNSVLPCFLVVIIGSTLSVAGAAWTDKPATQVLTTGLPFHYHYTDVHMQANIARHLCALKKGIQSLEVYYRNLDSPPDCFQDYPQCFPYPIDFIDKRNTCVIQPFKYASQISEQKLLFLATTTNSSEEIIIKFTQTYSEEVHLFCAGIGCAPALLGLRELPGGWYMVVMRSLRGRYVDLADCDSVPPELYEEIKKKLVGLHRHGYVHGDIRIGNIMVLKEDKKSFMLLDFDWAGKIGEARYPLNVNKANVRRPEGVTDGKMIKTEHDIAMLGYMR